MHVHPLTPLPSCTAFFAIRYHKRPDIPHGRRPPHSCYYLLPTVSMAQCSHLSSECIYLKELIVGDQALGIFIFLVSALDTLFV